MVVVFTAPQINNLKKNSYIMQTCLLRDHGEHDGKAKVRGE